MNDEEKTTDSAEEDVLSSYDEPTRQAIIAGLSARAIDPDTYGIVVWLFGWLGLHRWLIDAPLTAMAQFLLVVSGVAFGVRGGLAVSAGDIAIGSTLLMVALAWWLYDLATQRQAIMRAQVIRETQLLRAIDARLGD